MKFFLDVGAHEGQTLEEVTKPEYGFDRIIAFEPMPVQYATLEARFGNLPRVTLLNYGLADRAGKQIVYGDNRGMESSTFLTKTDVDPGFQTTCDFLSAADFFRAELGLPGDRAVVKLNCEGGEVAILDVLIDSGEIWKAANVMIDFDIRKVAGQEDEEGRILAKLAEVGFTDYVLCENVMRGPTHQERIAAWLRAL